MCCVSDGDALTTSAEGDATESPTARFDLMLAHADSVFCVIERAAVEKKGDTEKKKEKPVEGKLLLVSDSAHRVLGTTGQDLVGCADNVFFQHTGASDTASRCHTRRKRFVELFPKDASAANELLSVAAAAAPDSPPTSAHLRALVAYGCFWIWTEAKLSSDVRRPLMRPRCSKRRARL